MKEEIIISLVEKGGGWEKEEICKTVFQQTPLRSLCLAVFTVVQFWQILSLVLQTDNRD